jgi:hypothetical protein
VSSSANQNQYSSYGSINKSMLSQSQHHHTVHPGSTSGGPPPLSIYQVKEHHNNYLMSHSRNYNYKRKSAVEMLAESKPYYVKSETVLDRHQQLNARSGGGSNTLSCELSLRFSLFGFVFVFFLFFLFFMARRLMGNFPSLLYSRAIPSSPKHYPLCLLPLTSLSLTNFRF